MKKIIGVSLIVLFGFILVACGASGGSSKPEDVAKQYVEYAYKGDSEGMLKLINMPENQKDGSKEIITGKLKQASAKAKEEADRKGGLKEVVVDSVEVDDPNGTGKVKVIAHFKNEGSESRTNNIRVIRSSDGWKIKL